jgi:hypothetical protein
MTSAAADLASIGSNVSAAHMVAAAPTVAVLPAAADEVSASIAHLFSQHAANYQALAAQAAAFNDQFVQRLSAGAFSYASIENAITSFLQNVNLEVDQAIFPLQAAHTGVLGGVLLIPILVAVFGALYLQTAWSVFLATGQILTPGAWLSELFRSALQMYLSVFPFG